MCTVLNNLSFLFDRLNPDKPQRLDIGKELKFGDRTEEENRRRALWDPIWSGSHPNLIAKGKKHPTWKGKVKFSDIKTEKTGKKKEEL